MALNELLGTLGALTAHGRNVSTNTYQSKEDGLNMIKVFGNVTFKNASNPELLDIDREGGGFKTVS